MRKLLLILLIVIATTLSSIEQITIEQVNKVPEPLKVLYPFSINMKFGKKFSYLKAELETKQNFAVFDEETLVANSTDSLNIKLVALKGGEQQVPAVKITLFDEMGIDTLFTVPFNINVLTLTDSTSTITDIKGLKSAKEPIELVSNNSWLWKLLLIIGIALLISIIGYLLYKNRNRISELLTKVGLKEEVIEIKPWDFALTELTVIKKKMLLTLGQEYQFSVELSLLVRRFIEKYYSFPAAERTTLELKKELKLNTVKNDQELINILEKMDIIKYTHGKNSHQAIDSDAIYNWFKGYVDIIKKEELAKVSSEEKK